MPIQAQTVLFAFTPHIWGKLQAPLSMRFNESTRGPEERDVVDVSFCLLSEYCAARH